MSLWNKALLRLAYWRELRETVSAKRVIAKRVRMDRERKRLAIETGNAPTYICSRCGDPVCPGPASCLSEDQ